jgi:hypothetical protein
MRTEVLPNYCNCKKANYLFIAFLAQNLSSYTERYQMFINGLKKDDFSIIGYVRKSPGAEACDNIVGLLNRMMSCLKDRSLVEKVYASPKALASSLLSYRDIVEPTALLSKLHGCAGTLKSKSTKRRSVMQPTWCVSDEAYLVCLENSHAIIFFRNQE